MTGKPIDDLQKQFQEEQRKEGSSQSKMQSMEEQFEEITPKHLISILWEEELIIL